MGAKASKIPAAKLDSYEKVVATSPRIERKGAGTPYTSLNGHMFSFLDKSGRMALRLPTETREAFLKKYRTKLFVAYETVMKEYVAVPDALLKRTRELAPYFAESVSYIASLKPKPTTRSAKKKGAAPKRQGAKKAGAKSSKKVAKTAGKKTAAAKKKTAGKKTARRKATGKKTARKRG